jgi:hypothetical protein
MSRSSLSRFPGAILRAVAEHFPDANRRSLRVEKMVLILILRANPGANLNSLWLDPPGVMVRKFSSPSLKGPQENFRTQTTPES